VVAADRRSAPDRAAFREAAARLGLAEVREGLWARPGALDPDRAPGERRVVDGQVTWVRGGRPDDVEVFVDAFDLGRWAEVAERLIGEMRAAQPALDEHRTDVVADTFVIAAAVLRHLLADPALPVELLPSGWPGDRLRPEFDRFDRAFKETWRAWYRAFRNG
jgi:phenylacetic acid degradation operon negative regulatory protein